MYLNGTLFDAKLHTFIFLMFSLASASVPFKPNMVHMRQNGDSAWNWIFMKNLAVLLNNF